MLGGKVVRFAGVFCGVEEFLGFFAFELGGVDDAIIWLQPVESFVIFF